MKKINKYAPCAQDIYIKTDHFFVNSESDLPDDGSLYSELDYKYVIVASEGRIDECPPDRLKLAGLIELSVGESIIDGVVVYTPAPDRAHIWTGTEWVFDNELFANEKLKAYENLKLARDNAFEVGFMLDDAYLVKSRVQDMTDANAVFNQFMAGVIVTSDWHHSNGVIETIDKDRFLVIYQAMGAYRSAQFKKEGILRAAVANATTIAGLDGIVWY